MTISTRLKMFQLIYLYVGVLVFWEVNEVTLSEDVVVVVVMLVAVMLWIWMRSRGHRSS
jgi:preprotein translocase subunit Sec61beta